jgi:hypothetical protein
LEAGSLVNFWQGIFNDWPFLRREPFGWRDEQESRCGCHKFLVVDENVWLTMILFRIKCQADFSACVAWMDLLLTCSRSLLLAPRAGIKHSLPLLLSCYSQQVLQYDRNVNVLSNKAKSSIGFQLANYSILFIVINIVYLFLVDISSGRHKECRA